MGKIDYDFTTMFSEDSCIDTQKNTLIIIDAAITALCLPYRPQFHILGGTALLFHGMNYTVTLDIDVANKIEQRVLDEIGDLISDDFGTINVLPSGYSGRLVRFMPNVLKSIDVYILSKEDLLITKLGSGRSKDVIDIIHTRMYDQCDRKVLSQVISELPCKEAEYVRQGIREYRLRKR